MLIAKHETKDFTMPKIGFPKLMKCIGDSLIVLFSAEGAGIVIVAGRSWASGQSSNTWSMCGFKDLPVGEEIILSNKEGN